MVGSEVVMLSRLQFGLTAMYHFLFVPLTLGLSVLLGIMETVYVMTGRQIWRDMVKFWGVLFGINFAMGVATGITMEFQFGTNWAYYSHYVGAVSYTHLDVYKRQECTYEWMESTEVINDEDKCIVHDANGNLLTEGDFVTVIKDLKIKNSSSVIKVGTKVKIMQLVESDHNIDGKVEGFGPMMLKSIFVKKI